MEVFMLFLFFHNKKHIVKGKKEKERKGKKRMSHSCCLSEANVILALDIRKARPT